jgi:hypothetical protein
VAVNELISELGVLEAELRREPVEDNPECTVATAAARAAVRDALEAVGRATAATGTAEEQTRSARAAEALALASLWVARAQEAARSARAARQRTVQMREEERQRRERAASRIHDPKKPPEQR